MKVGLCTIAFQDLGLKEVFKIAQKAMFGGIEIWGKMPHMGNYYDENYVKKVKDMANSMNLEIVSFGSYITMLMDNFEDLSREALKITKGLGTSIIRIWSPDRVSEDLSLNVYKKVIIQLKQFCKIARDFNITLGFEFHDGCITDTSSGIVQLIEDVNEPNLKTYWQPSFLEGAEDFYISLRKVIPYLVNVHAQNFKRTYEHRTYLSEGDVDYRRVVNILEDGGYNGYIEVEFVGNKNPIDWAKKDRDFLVSLLRR